MSDTDAVSVARLISLVKERPVLWDRQEEVYKNRKLTKQAWTEICEALINNYHDLGEHEKAAIGRSIIGKWANLRDNWLRYWRKRQDLLRVGSSTRTLKKYVHHDQLLFLSKVYDPEGQQEVEEIQVEVDVISDPEFESTVEFDETSQSSWNTAQYLQLPTPHDQSERHLYFFHSILPMICDFDDDQVLEFHAGVLEWVKRVKRREFVNLQNCHSLFISHSLQDPSIGAGDVLNAKPQAATTSDCSCKSTHQTQVKKEPQCYMASKTLRTVTEESTSTSNTLEETTEPAKCKLENKITCDDTDFVSLRDTVNKLEKITVTLESHIVESKKDLLGHNFGSLLAQLSPAKIQSLKRKIVKEVVREGFKKVKVEQTSRCVKTESLDSDLVLKSNLTDRKEDAEGDLSSCVEHEVTPSILRDTLQHFLVHK